MIFQRADKSPLAECRRWFARRGAVSYVMKKITGVRDEPIIASKVTRRIKELRCRQLLRKARVPKGHRLARTISTLI